MSAGIFSVSVFPGLLSFQWLGVLQKTCLLSSTNSASVIKFPPFVYLFVAAHTTLAYCLEEMLLEKDPILQTLEASKLAHISKCVSRTFAIKQLVELFSWGLK